MNLQNNEKEAIYKQILNFNNSLSDPSKVTSSSYQEAYYYVNDETAKNMAEFFEYILENNTSRIKNIIDLTFGSGNLTSHLILDSNIDAELIVFNDINSDTKANQTLKINNASSITGIDILDLEFKLKLIESLNVNPDIQDIKFDLIVFNPQIGGSYTSGELKLEHILPVVSDKSIENYIKDELGVQFNFNIEPNNVDKSILISSDDATKNDMKDKLDRFKIFNYYDVFYKSKRAKEEGEKSNIVKLRKNIDNIASDNHWMVFLGEKKIFNNIFADYNIVWHYLTNEGKDFFIASKDHNKQKARVCYEKNEINVFMVNDDCQRTITLIGSEQNLEKLFGYINGSISTIVNSLKENPFGVESDDGLFNNMLQIKPFANFLINAVLLSNMNDKKFINFLNKNEIYNFNSDENKSFKNFLKEEK
ncbi:MAG: hypothetical protein ACYCSW_08760 [bacterium]